MPPPSRRASPPSEALDRLGQPQTLYPAPDLFSILAHAPGDFGQVAAAPLTKRAQLFTQRTILGGLSRSRGLGSNRRLGGSNRREDDLSNRAIEPLSSLALAEHDDVVAICDLWPKPGSDPSLAMPVVSDIPTLVSSGAFDPITPPSYGTVVSDALTNARSVVFANSGHGALTDSECSQGLALAFLNDPQAAVDSLDTACADEIEIQFATSQEQYLDELPVAQRQAIQRRLRALR